jgi:hypothetical protein
VGHVDEVDISATSGDIALEGGAAQKVKIGSTSGKVDVRLTAFEALDIDATSGDITAALPSAPSGMPSTRVPAIIAPVARSKKQFAPPTRVQLYCFSPFRQ